MKKISIDNDSRKLNVSCIVVGYLEENKTEKIEFIIPDKYKEFGKKACFNANGQKFAKIFDDINGSTLTFTRDITKYKELEMSIEFFKIENEDEIIARTSNLHIIIENAVICDDDISPDEPKIIILDKLIEEVTKLDVLVTKNEKKREEYYQEIQEKVDNGDFNGATFTPSVDTDGNISWSNDKNLSNPTTQNIKGPKGEKGDTYTLTEQDKQDISSMTVESSESAFNQYYNGKLEDFNSNATSKTNDFDTNTETKTAQFNSNYTSKVQSFNENSTSKTNDYNTNATNKTNEYNTNASTKLQEYNTNADNKIAEYDLHSQELDNKIIDTRNELERVKNDVLETGTDTDTFVHLEDSAMAEYQELSVDGVCEQETTSVSAGDEYDSPSPDHPQPISVIENSLKITSCNKNLFKSNIIKDTYYNIDIDSNGEEIKFTGTNSSSTQYPSFTFYANGDFYKNRWWATKDQIKTDKGFFTKEDTNYKLSIMPSNSTTEYTIVIGKETSVIQKSKIIGKTVYTIEPSSEKINYISIGFKPLEQTDISFKIQLEEGTQATPYEQHLETQITANLPEGEFIGKINDTYKDTLKVEYNETDGQYHLKLYKNVYKNNSYNGESYNYYISTTARKDGNIECGELQTGQVVYYDGDETIIDLGIVDQLITYNEVTNLFTDSNLMPTINAKYYRNFISTIQNLQVNEKALKQELTDINVRLSALETAQTNVASESEVIE